jgi:DNA repair protein RadC
MSNALRLLPDHERPRERLIRYGPSALADRELLAMVLRNGGYERSAIDLASDLIVTAGSLQRVALADVDDLRAVDGMGIAKSSAVVAAFELGRRAAQPQLNSTLATSDDIANAAQPYLMGIPHERLVLLIADAGLHLRRVVVMSEGTRTATLVSPRDILHAVLRSDGLAFALAHNHPSGSLHPSEEDVRATRAMSSAASIVGIRFLDHVIVTNDDWRSMT